MSLLLLRPVLLGRSTLVRRSFHLLDSIRLQKVKPSAALAEARQRSELSEEVKPLGERVKENTKTASYMGVILLGVGVTGIMLFAIFRELFSSQSPNSVYSEALEKCKDHPKVQDTLGTPIKGFGEETRRGRRRHVAHTLYEKDGKKFMRMQFYIQGARNKGTVHLEMKENDSGKFDYRYLFVTTDYYPNVTIVLEDNRASDSISSSSLTGTPAY